MQTSTTVSTDSDGAKLDSTWSYQQNETNASTVSKGVVLHFPRHCVRVGDENRSTVDRDGDGDIDEADNLRCTQQTVEKSITVMDLPQSTLDALEAPITLGQPQVRRLPRRCKLLDEHTTVCEEKTVAEYYVTSEEADEELDRLTRHPFHHTSTALYDAQTGSNGS